MSPGTVPSARRDAPPGPCSCVPCRPAPDSPADASSRGRRTTCGPAWRRVRLRSTARATGLRCRASRKARACASRCPTSRSRSSSACATARGSASACRRGSTPSAWRRGLRPKGRCRNTYTRSRAPWPVRRRRMRAVRPAIMRCVSYSANLRISGSKSKSEGQKHPINFPKCIKSHFFQKFFSKYLQDSEIRRNFALAKATKLMPLASRAKRGL